jgi:KDO2-lipid IV(A) lauroyltransferase
MSDRGNQLATIQFEKAETAVRDGPIATPGEGSGPGAGGFGDSRFDAGGVGAGPFAPGHSTALRLFFFCATKFPRLMRLIGRPMTALAAALAPGVRRNILANLRQISGSRLPAPFRSARHVLLGFYDFVLDLAQLQHCGREEIGARVAEIRGKDRYLASRTSGKGAVIVTGHMGSFEAGLVALSDVEPVIHVVFKRDLFADFERLRADFRRKLGIREAAIDDGFSSLIQMRDALFRNEVVVLQADRAYPGQRFLDVPVAAGHLRLPVGPVTLARIGECPIIPIFTTRLNEPGRPGKFVVHILEPIDVGAEGEAGAMARLGQAIESMLRQYPEQWLMLQKAFVEDQA